MKSLIAFTLNPGQHTTGISVSLLLLRLVAGAFMLTHGDGKFIKLFGDEPISFADPLGIGEVPSLVLTVFAEVFCSVFIIFGLATRLSAIPLLITMLVAALVIHAGDGFGDQELPLFYAAVYLVLIISGPGKYSLDNQLHKMMVR